MRILAAKQVGEVSYFVKDIETLYNILKFDRIKYSKHKQNNTSRNKKDGSVSLSRSMNAAPRRNPNRWVYGVILDGNKLSDRYHIEPHHYLGSNVPKLLIKSLTRYTNDVCIITFANWPNRNISTKFLII